MNLLKKYIPAFGLFVTLLIAWELYVQAGFIQQSVLPSPTAIFRSLLIFKSQLLGHALYTISEVVIGYFLAVGLAVAASIGLYFSARARRAVYPLLIVAHIIPIIALAPLLLVWFGFGIWPKVIVVVLYSFFPIAATLTDGLTNTPQHLDDYAKSLGASKWQKLRYVNFQAALPLFFSGLKIAAIYTVTGAVVGEFVGAYRGLGIFLQTSASSRATALVFANIVVIIGITLIMVGAVVLVENRALRWRKYGQQ